MIDLQHIGAYRENNRIEAKKALGGLPHSIWETYSAFANTMGGILLLGVEEYRDHSLHPVDLPDPEGMVQKFWDLLNRPETASVNILTRRHVRIETVEGNRIIVIRIPRARRFDRPVYVEGNPLTGTYRRNGEGDYRCTREEVLSMQRDAARESQDMVMLPRFGLDVLDPDSLHRYRSRMATLRPGHPWEHLGEEDFLLALGAARRGTDGTSHPTAAGLLMFGCEYAILSEFPAYCLDYRAQPADGTPWTDRVISSSGTWSGNLHDFYFLVRDRLCCDLEGDGSAAEPQVRKALREALANSLMNADYRSREGVTILRQRCRILFSNPGSFRISVEEARRGGISDPRNGALTRMFQLIDVGQGTGGGLQDIFSIWQAMGWETPCLEEDFAPERIRLTLSLGPGAPEPAHPGRSRSPGARTAVQCSAILEYLTDHVHADTGQIAALLGVGRERARSLLNQLSGEGLITPESGTRPRSWRLRS